MILVDAESAADCTLRWLSTIRCWAIDDRIDPFVRAHLNSVRS